MAAEFVDTNVVLYLLSADTAKADRAEQVLLRRPRISVQVLNEALVNCRRKAGLDWAETAQFLGGLRQLCPVADLTAETHDIGRAVAERYGFAIYDAMIVAAALQADCTILWTEDLSDGQWIESRLQIRNPFGPLGP